MSDSWNCGISCPDTWVPLPLEEDVDLRAWAREQAHAIVRRGGQDGPGSAVLAVLEGDLVVRAKDSRSRAPIFAFALYPDAFPEPLAVLEVDRIEPDDAVPELTLEWLAETFSAPDFGEAETVYATLPAGPAVRVRQRFAGAGTSAGGERAVIETLTYGLLPPGIDAAVVMLVSWTALAAGDALVDAADRIVETLQAVTAQ